MTFDPTSDHSSTSAVSAWSGSTAIFSSHRDRSQPFLKAGCWVRLRELPTPFSHDEALLLCPDGGDRWLVWIPDHGEAILNTDQITDQIQVALRVC